MGTDVYFTGVFIAPNASVTKGNMNSYPTKAEVNAGTRAAPINGAIWAKQLTAGTDALTKQISKAACESLAIPGTYDDGTSVCPITNVTPNVPAAIVEPCTSGLDCCGGFCRIAGGALAGTCSDEVPECSKINERCTTREDCCASAEGEPQNVCIGGFCGFVALE